MPSRETPRARATDASSGLSLVARPLQCEQLELAVAALPCGTHGRTRHSSKAQPSSAQLAQELLWLLTAPESLGVDTVVVHPKSALAIETRRLRERETLTSKS